MADIKLSDGRELVGDMHKVNVSEYRRILDKNQPQEEEDELVGRVFGLTAEEVGKLPWPDYRLLTRAFFRLATNPFGEGDKKNSESALT